MPEKFPISRQPLFLQVKRAIVHNISSGEWPPGAMIPSEPELCAKFGVSIGTLRRAIGELVAEEKLIRRQGHGTFVRSYNHNTYWNRFQRYESSEGKLIVWSSELVQFEKLPATETIAKALGLTPGEQVIHFVRKIWKADKTIYCGRDDVYLPANKCSGLNPSDFDNLSCSLYAFFERKLNIVITSVSDSLQAFIVDDALSSFTGLSVGKPMFCLTRIGYTYNQSPIEYRIEYTLAEELKIRLN